MALGWPLILFDESGGGSHPRDAVVFFDWVQPPIGIGSHDLDTEGPLTTINAKQVETSCVTGPDMISSKVETSCVTGPDMISSKAETVVTKLVEPQFEPAAVPYWTSCRYVLALVVFYCFCVLYMARFNLSVAIICMAAPLNTTDDVMNGSSSSAACSMSPNVTNTQSVVGFYPWSKSLQGTILGSFFYGYVVAQVPGAWVTQRYGPKRVTIAALILQCLTTTFTPLAANYKPGTVGPYLLIAVRVLLGVSAAIIVPSVTSIWGTWAPPFERTKLVGFCFSGTVIGTVIIMPLSGYLCVHGFAGGWPSIFYVSGMLCFLAVVLWCGLVYDSPIIHPRITQTESHYITSSLGHTEQAVSTIPWRRIVTSPPVHALALATFTSSYGAYTLTTTLPTYMKEVLRFDIQTNGFLSSMPFIAEFISSVACSISADLLRVRTKLSTTVVRKIFQTSAHIGPAVFVVLTGFISCDVREYAVLLLSLGLVFQAGIRAGHQVNAVDIAPRYAGIVFALVNSVGVLSGAIAPLVAGMLTPNGTKSEWQTVFYIMAAVLIFGAAVYAIFGSGKEQHWALDGERDNKKIEIDIIRVEENDSEVTYL